MISKEKKNLKKKTFFFLTKNRKENREDRIEIKKNYTNKTICFHCENVFFFFSFVCVSVHKPRVHLLRGGGGITLDSLVPMSLKNSRDSCYAMPIHLFAISSSFAFQFFFFILSFFYFLIDIA